MKTKHQLRTKIDIIIELINDCRKLMYDSRKMLLNHEDAEWRNLISKSELISFQSILSRDEIILNKEKLKELRYQHYVHKDEAPKSNIFNIRFYFENLLKITESIIAI
ncbi:MAG: hypothetical protein ABI549_02260 [Flavobacterium sp.]|uniref:hypothetical protein n=1 Tax=Flavobacterium sp. TaxID=239 RepID=UPI0032643504